MWPVTVQQGMLRCLRATAECIQPYPSTEAGQGMSGQGGMMMWGLVRGRTAASWNSARSCSSSARSGPSTSYVSSLPPASASRSSVSGLHQQQQASARQSNFAKE